MATKKVGTLVKEARTAADLTQEQLARKVTGANADDISELERGKVDFTQAQLKQIAKACGVTQASLLDAPKNLKASSAKKASTSTSKKSSSSTTKKSSSGSSTKKSSSSSKKSTSSSSSKTSMKVSASEKKLVELYREASSDTKKFVTAILKGEYPQTGPLFMPIGDANDDGRFDAGDILGSIVASALDALGKR